jgi:hypothetical protein
MIFGTDVSEEPAVPSLRKKIWVEDYFGEFVNQLTDYTTSSPRRLQYNSSKI